MADPHSRIGIRSSPGGLGWKLGLVLGCVALMAPMGRAQFVAPGTITLTGGSYTQDWGAAAFSSFPAGFTGGFYTVTSTDSKGDAEAVAFNSNKTPTSASSPGALSISVGVGLFGYATGGNAMLAVSPDNNKTYGLVMGLDTTGLTQVNLAYDLVVANADASYRGAGIVVQYRVGNSGGWTTIDDSYYISQSASPPANGTTTSYNYTLATEALDQPLVEVRWQGYQQPIVGYFTSIGIDNIAVTAVPEPASYALLAGLLALAGVVGWRRRRLSGVSRH